MVQRFQCRLAIAVGLVVLLTAVPSAPGQTRATGAVLRGQTDQAQPMLLRLMRAQRLVGFRIQYLTLDCRGPGSSPVSPSVGVVRAKRLLPYGRGGRLSTRYSTHRHERDVNDGLVQYDVHTGTRVTFRAALGRRGTPSGSFRVVRRVRGRVIGEAGLEPIRYGCDTGTHRWRAPRFVFSGPWRPTGPLVQPRLFGALVALRGGRVLLAGGDLGESDAAPATETYDPGRDRWTRAPAMLEDRESPAAVRLADGRVLLAGGSSSGRALRSAEIYSPARRSWRPARSMLLRRSGGSATLLGTGQVLVTGGGSDSRLLSAELYDPVANRWTRVPDAPLPADHANIGGAAPSGGAMVVTSDDFSTNGVSSIYDPASNRWSPPQAVPGIRGDDEGLTAFASLTLLRDGRVLLVGNCRRGMRTTAIYAGTGWTPGPTGAPCGYGPATAMLPSGRVLLTGYARAAIFDPRQNRWTAAPHYSFEANAFVDREYISPTRGGALVVGNDFTLNRFTASERFLER